MSLDDVPKMTEDQRKAVQEFLDAVEMMDWVSRQVSPGTPLYALSHRRREAHNKIVALYGLDGPFDTWDFTGDIKPGTTAWDLHVMLVRRARELKEMKCSRR